MHVKVLQDHLRQSAADMKTPFRSGAEVMLAITEELGEVATEVALLEKVGSKAGWSKTPSVARLTEEITHVINTVIALANLYDIDLDQAYAAIMDRSRNCYE